MQWNGIRDTMVVQNEKQIIKGSIVYCSDLYLTGKVETILGDKALVSTKWWTSWIQLSKLIKLR